MTDTWFPSSSPRNSSLATTATRKSGRLETDDPYSCSSSSSANSTFLMTANTKTRRQDFNNSPTSTGTSLPPAKRAKTGDSQRIDQASTLSDTPPPTTPTEKQSITRSQKIKRNDVKEKVSQCLDDSCAICQMEAWTWELTTSKPARVPTIDFGPMNEVESFYGNGLIGYQGLPKELARHISDLQNKNMDVGRADAMYFERSYREAKELELAGAEDPDFAPEECFLDVINGHMFRLERAKKGTERERLEAKKQAKGFKCLEWEMKEENSAWLKWGEQHLELADCAPAELVEQVDSSGLMSSPMLEPDGQVVVAVTETELTDSASDSSCPTSPSFYGLDQPIHSLPPTELAERINSLDLTTLNPDEQPVLSTIELIDSTPHLPRLCRVQVKPLKAISLKLQSCRTTLKISHKHGNSSHKNK